MDACKFDKIGQVALELDWVAESQLDEALLLAQEMRVPLGLTLVHHGCLTHNELRALIEGQALVRDGALERSMVVMALTIVGWSAVTLSTALAFLGVDRQGFSGKATGNSLGLLLADARCLAGDQVSASVQASHATGMPLGQILVLRQMISAQCLSAALEAQKLIRSQAMTREAAVRALNLAFGGATTHGANLFPAVSPTLVPPLRGIRLGEMLVLSEVASRDLIEQALESALINGLPLGEALTVFAAVSQSVLTAALELQRMLRCGEITLDESIFSLARAHASGLPVRVSIEEARRRRMFNLQNPSLAQFLKSVGVIEAEQLQELVERFLDSSSLLSPMLSGRVDQFAVRTAARLTYLVKTGMFVEDAARFIFHYCVSEHVDVDRFLVSAGWYRPVEPGSNIVCAPTGNIAVV